MITKEMIEKNTLDYDQMELAIRREMDRIRIGHKPSVVFFVTEEYMAKFSEAFGYNPLFLQVLVIVEKE